MLVSKYVYGMASGALCYGLSCGQNQTNPGSPPASFNPGAYMPQSRVTPSMWMSSDGLVFIFGGKTFDPGKSSLIPLALSLHWLFPFHIIFIHHHYHIYIYYAMHSLFACIAPYIYPHLHTATISQLLIGRCTQRSVDVGWPAVDSDLPLRYTKPHRCGKYYVYSYA